MGLELPSWRGLPSYQNRPSANSFRYDFPPMNSLEGKKATHAGDTYNTLQTKSRQPQNPYPNRVDNPSVGPSQYRMGNGYPSYYPFNPTYGEHYHTQDPDLDRLLEGVQFFQRQFFPAHRAEFERLAQGQHPASLFISCIDSRIDPLLITHSKPGDMFVIRNAGNVIPKNTQGKITVEEAELDFAVNKYHVKNIVICGHSDCGAMRAFLDPEKFKSAKDLSQWIQQYKRDELKPLKAHFIPNGAGPVEALSQYNVVHQLEVLSAFPSLQKQLNSGELKIHGWFYNIKNGEITVFDPQKKCFIPLKQHYSRAIP